MAEKRRNLALAGYDEIFGGNDSQGNGGTEKVQMISVKELFPFKDHPFRVVDDEAMLRTVESVSQFGVIVPAIVRPREEGGYEIVSGHRRKHAAELAGLTEIPVIVRDLDDDAATILMVDSNLQRETLLPSERAWAYRMKLEAMRHQGLRTDLSDSTSAQIGRKLEAGKEAREVLAEQVGTSRNQISRFIRLTYLLPDLIDMVDAGKLGFNAAVELSYLDDQQQFDFLDAMEYSQNVPSLSQAQKIKKMCQSGECDEKVMQTMLSEDKKQPEDKVTFKGDFLRKYFPKNYTPQQMEEVIVKLLKQWQKKRQREQEL